MTEPDENEGRTRSERLHEAISSTLADCAEHPVDRGVIVGWIFVAEVIGDDGEPYFRSLYHADSSPWRRLGLLDYATTCERAAIANYEAEAEES